jgi:hypothetical protein
MEYNSQKENLVIPEYGRNIQNMILHIKEIEKKEDRQEFVERLIELMHQMNPQEKNLLDYKPKIWHHILQIAGHDLDVDIPDEVKMSEEKEVERQTLSYPSFENKYRHYGNNVIKLINKAIDMEDGPEKNEFVRIIATYMKTAYRTWNREHYVSDDIVKGDLVSISKGKLTISEEAVIDNGVSNNNSYRRKKPNYRSSNTRNRNNNNRNRRRK